MFNDFENLKNRKYEHFKIVKKADSFHSATVTKDDFPITIRNYHKDDYIVMKYGKKKINRFFIDNKIHLKGWPILLL